MKGKVKIMAKNEWIANATQKQFMGALSKDNYLSLKQVNAKLELVDTDKEIKTGSINALGVNGKGLVESKADQIKYTAKIVETRVYADGTEIVIKKTKEGSETGYKLV